ncbi:hypothetical protein SUDANB145_07255 (plasmid) [Streptomyces sp. enrichment culture]|uniref:hypothetical protein n=1 Tax=Streptomyces sp. enrichment culture TaxID=1795815 RepID=UPI003F5798EF
MGAALHLAHAHQQPTRKRKRKGGGGGGDGYDALVTRVYQDQRMTPEARELILLLAWLAARDPDRYDTDGQPVSWRKRASAILDKDSPSRRSRLADLLYADRPRYEDQRDGWEQRTCAAPMIRRAGLCGQHAVGHDYTVDPDTGWRTAVWYCRRHEPWGRELHARRLADPGPEPIPNAGGLVTSYLLAEGQEAAWARLYKEAAVWKHDRHWEPPRTYGVVADDWPVPGRDPVPPRARLRLVLGGLEDA